jgi:hypothetical protein
MRHQPPTPGPLTDAQHIRLEGARHDLEYARSADVAQLDEGGLILLLDRLRGRLGDLLDLVNEVCDAETGVENTP